MFFCDLLRLRLKFCDFNFADEIFFLEEKSCKTLNSEFLILRLILNFSYVYKRLAKLNIYAMKIRLQNKMPIT